MIPENPPRADAQSEAEARAWITNWRAGQTDDDIWAMCYIQAHVSGGANDFVKQKWLQMGLAELARRSNERLRASIDIFSRSSDRLGRWVLWMTVVLTALTAVLVVDVIVKWATKSF
jgi:hypothetical protein